MTSAGSTVTLDDERKAQIKELVCEILEIEPADVSPTSLFKEEHDADSLRAIEILAALERTLDITIDQADLARMVNLEGVYAVVAEAGAR
ncbi:acyl carrier protein [Micromonospora sp. DR5-3]|uniref:acyl carrier protein n=1 Tax=unclassified Micromonospora TaxID=2617518 RepID=UPI0011D6A413|nr:MULTISPECIES: acyl carrier protein [unclassified Micromonospora]MCW3817580.1 acyl carrier protein [Micromonospora sp. DR5-3]TYC22056.1 acyl carrier protein [Micromonospora sp. MP36]